MSRRKSGAVRWGPLFVLIVASNQTLGAGAQSLTIAAPTATLATPGVSVLTSYQRPFSQRGIRTWGPQSPSATPSAGGTTLAAGSQTLVVTAPTAARIAGAVTLSGGAQTLALTAPVAAQVVGAATLPSGPQTLALTAPAPVLSLATVRAAGAQTVALTPPATTLVAGVSVVAAGAQTLALTAPVATALVAGAQGVSVPIPFRRPMAARGIHTWGQVSPSTTPGPAASTLPAGTQTLVVTVPTATPIAGASAVPAGAQTLVITAPAALLLAAGPQTLAAGTQTLAITAPVAGVGTPGISVPISFRTTVIRKLAVGRWGPVSVSTTPPPPTQYPLVTSQTLAITAPTATSVAGAVTQAAGVQTLAITAPTAVVGRILTAGTQTVTVTAPSTTVSLATIRLAGAQTVAIIAPVANRLAGAVTQAAGAQTIAVTAPVVVRTATITLATGPQTVALSAPVAVRTIGAVTLQAGTQAVALAAPGARLLGGSTLPSNIIVATIVSTGPRRTLAITPVSYAATVLADDPVAYWRLGELSGTAAADATGHGHLGTYQAGVTLGVPGVLADGTRAIELNHTATGRVDLPQAALAAMTTGCTIEGWLFIDTYAEGVANIAWSGGEPGLNYLGWSGTGQPYAGLGVDGLAWGAGATDPLFAWALDTWYHVVLTWQAGDRIRLYSDGVLIGTSAVIDPPNATVVMGTGVGTIGNFPASAGPTLYSWDGTLDEVALYAVALTPAQIATHYRRRWARWGGRRSLTFTGPRRRVEFTG